MTHPLSPGDIMPAILGKDADGNDVDIVASVAGHFAFIQLFRGHWWPYCRQQLVDISVHAGPFKTAEVKVVAASVDSVEQTNDLANGLRIEFPMYAEVDAHAVAEATGAFIETGDRIFIHATGFVLTPDGEVGTAVYATGPIGRMTPSEILRAISFARDVS